MKEVVYQNIVTKFENDYQAKKEQLGDVKVKPQRLSVFQQITKKIERGQLYMNPNLLVFSRSTKYGTGSYVHINFAMTIVDGALKEFGDVFTGWGCLTKESAAEKTPVEELSFEQVWNMIDCFEVKYQGMRFTKCAIMMDYPLKIVWVKQRPSIADILSTTKEVVIEQWKAAEAAKLTVKGRRELKVAA